MIRRAACQLVTTAQRQAQQAHKLGPILKASSQQIRTLTAKSPGTDPLELLRSESEGRNLCDAAGYRKPGTHWAMALAAAGETTCHPPNLRTINIQRITTDGVDFVVKSSSCSYANSNPVSFLYTVGKYRPGETVEQWRADGSCVSLDLGAILDKVPDYAVAETVASVRLTKEGGGDGGDAAAAVSKYRTSMGNQAHFMEIVQKTKNELDKGSISDEELESCLGAWRFEPNRMERMQGGPDQIMWDRWEWLRSDGPGSAAWAKAEHILPY